MCKNLNEYLKKLRKELNGCDRALIQDALSDAEEYLTTSLENIRRKHQELGEEESFRMAEEDFGSPAEIAQDYIKYESHSSPGQSKETVPKNKKWWNFLKIFTDIRDWGATLYMTISLLTGIVFFTWVVTGLSVSLSLLILIIGIPIAGLYLLSIRGLALLKGRIVEALLGIRMPRRAVFVSNEKGLWSKFKELVSSGVTWKVQIYMILQLGLGIVYFTLTWVLFAWSLGMISVPIMYIFWPKQVLADIHPSGMADKAHPSLSCCRLLYDDGFFAFGETDWTLSGPVCQSNAGTCLKKIRYFQMTHFLFKGSELLLPS